MSTSAKHRKPRKAGQLAAQRAKNRGEPQKEIATAQSVSLVAGQIPVAIQIARNGIAINKHDPTSDETAKANPAVPTCFRREYGRRNSLIQYARHGGLTT